MSGGDTSWDTGESLSLASPDSGSSDTSGGWGSGGGGGGASFWGGGTGGGLSGGSLFGSGGSGSFWGVSSGTTSSDVKVTKSPTDTTASVEQTPPENVTETENENVTVDLGADFKATVGDEIGLDAIVTGGTSPYNYTWKLGDGTSSYSKSVTHIYGSTGNYTISLNVTDADGQSDTDSITVWIQESTTTTKTKNDTLTLNEQVSNLSAGETLVIPSGSYSSVNVDVPGVTLVGDGSVTINGLSILSDNVKVKNVEIAGPLSVTGSDYSMYDSTIDNTGGAWAIEVYETGAYFDGVTGEANNGMYVGRALQDIQYTSGSLTANNGQGVLVKKHTGLVEVTDSSVTATGAGIYREHSSQLYLTRNAISGSPNVERVLNKPPQPAFTYNDAPLDTGGYGVKFDPSPTTDPESEPITSMKWDFNNDSSWDAYGEGVKQYTYPSYGTYNVTLSVTDYHGVTVNLERQITINEYYFSISTNKFTINTSEPVEFNATTSVPDSSIDHYNIDYDGDGTAEEQVSSLPVTHTYTTAGNYSPQIELVTTNSGALVNSTSIQVLAPPTAAFTINTSITNPGEDVRFNASASTDPDGGDISYEWDFGDGTLATGENLTHAYSNTGDYTATLTVTDDEGETNTTTKTISVTKSGSTPTSGLFAYWPLDETSGNIAEDKVSGQFNGTLESGIDDGPEPGFPGISGTSYNFTPASDAGDYVSLPDESGQYPQKSWTISAWVRPSSGFSNGKRAVFDLNSAGSSIDERDSGIQLYFENGPITLFFKPKAAGDLRKLSTSSTPSVDSWTLVTATRNSTTGETAIYMDKTLIAKKTFETGEMDYDAAAYDDNSVNIGRFIRSGASHNGFAGQIDEVRLYNRSLSKSEVQSLYDTENTPPTADFTYSPSQPIPGETISFDASPSSDEIGSITTYEWDFNNDGTRDSTGQTTTHSYSSTGNKTVTLTVTDNNDSTNSITKVISITEPDTTLVWNTSGDWDSAASQTGIVHDASHGGADVLMLGYSYSDQPNLDHYWALAESSGDAENFGGGTSGNVQGPTQGAEGLLGQTAYSFDGNDDLVNIGTDIITTPNTEYTHMGWIYLDDSASISNQYQVMGDGDNPNVIYDGGDTYSLQIGYGTNSFEGSTQINSGEWYHYAFSAVDGGEGTLYINGESDTSISGISLGDQGGEGYYLGADDDNQRYWDGKIAEYRVYNRALNASEIQSIYNTTKKGSLQTSVKTFYTAIKPNTLNVTHSLNGQQVTLTIVGSPGTAGEETNTVTLDSSTSYDLTWNSAHSQYRVDVKLETSNISTTPSINRISLKSAPSADYTYSPTQPTTNDAVSFDASGSSGSITSYEWDFNNDGTIDATGQTTSHTFTSSGDYSVTLKATDMAGLTSTSTKTITIGDATTQSADLQLYYKLDSGSGSTAIDSANGNDGSIKGATWTNGYDSSALSFDGNSDQIAVNTDVVDNSDWTVTAWVKPDNDGTTKNVFHTGNSGNSGFEARINSDMTMSLGLPGKSNPSAGPQVPAGEWSFVAWSYDYSTGQVTYHLDTASQSSTGDTFNNPGSDTSIGIEANGGKDYAGKIDSVRFYTTKLSDSEITSIYESELPVADFTLSPSPAKTNESITFDGSPTDTGSESINSYEWDFDNDGTTDATGQNVTHSYSSTGEHTVVLTVTSSSGKISTTQQTINVESATNVVDDFETGTLEKWTNKDNNWQISSSSYNGTYSLNFGAGVGPSRTGKYTGSQTFKPGNTLEWYHKWGGNSNGATFLFFGGTFASNSWDTGYYVGYNIADKYMDVTRQDSSGGTRLKRISVSTGSSNTWYRNIVKWRTNGTIVYTVYTLSDNKVGEITVNDTTYLDQRGLGLSAHGDTWVDEIVIKR